jgi:hypothetical protein
MKPFFFVLIFGKKEWPISYKKFLFSASSRSGLPVFLYSVFRFYLPSFPNYFLFLFFFYLSFCANVKFSKQMGKMHLSADAVLQYKSRTRVACLPLQQQRQV